jgi:hypothetical protein
MIGISSSKLSTHKALKCICRAHQIWEFDDYGGLPHEGFFGRFPFFLK